MRKTMRSPCLSVAFAAVALAVGCSKPSEPEGTATAQSAQSPPAQATPDTCSQYTPIAADFINLYIRHLNDREVAADAPDTYAWLKSNALVDPALASAYAKVDLVDGDPILNAQDYPESFDPVGCPEAPDTVRLEGNGMDLNVDVRIALVDGSPKIVGVGSLNMQEASAATALGSESVGPSPTTLPADSPEAMRRLKAYEDARSRGEYTGPEEASHYTGFDPSAKFLGKYPVYTDLDCEMTQGERTFWCAHGKMGEETEVTIAEHVTMLLNGDVLAQQGSLACSQHLCITREGKAAGALQPAMWAWMQEHCRFDNRNYYQCDS